MYTVRLRLPAETAGSVSSLLELTEHGIVQREDCEAGETWLEMFFVSGDEAKEEAGNLVRILEMFGCEDVGEPMVEESDDRDWQEAWKEHFHAMKVSPRVTVCPTWETVEAGPGEIVVRVDPGMSFGTGQHPTTQACLIFLDELSADGYAGRLCDVGCGSGIVSITASRLGFGPISAFDQDPVAVRMTEENLGLNAVTGVDVRCIDLGQEAVREIPVADVVVVNMLSNLLEQFASAIVERLASGPDARLILAGMLGETQYAWTRVVYEQRGLRTLDERREGEWVSLMFGWQV